jgi:hypothetical protein
MKLVHISYERKAPRHTFGVGFVEVKIHATVFEGSNVQLVHHVICEDWEDYFCAGCGISEDSVLGCAEVPAEVITEVLGVKFSPFEIFDGVTGEKGLIAV